MSWTLNSWRAWTGFLPEEKQALHFLGLALYKQIFTLTFAYRYCYPAILLHLKTECTVSRLQSVLSYMYLFSCTGKLVFVKRRIIWREDDQGIFSAEYFLDQLPALIAHKTIALRPNLPLHCSTDKRSSRSW